MPQLDVEQLLRPSPLPSLASRLLLICLEFFGPKLGYVEFARRSSKVCPVSSIVSSQGPLKQVSRYVFTLSARMSNFVSFGE